MSNYYLPDGQTEINKSEFIQFYSALYYMTVKKSVEDKILGIFKVDEFSNQNIIDILAWKSGNIDYLKSNKEEIKYKENFIGDKEKTKVKIYSNIIEISKVKDILNDMNNDEVSTYIVGFKDRETCIGPVYALTFRFFGTKGKEPIYDSFARKALWSIIGEKDGLAKYPTFNNIEKIYNIYHEMIVSEFSDEYKNRSSNPDEWRKVDQALWTYGHCIHVKEFANKQDE